MPLVFDTLKTQLEKSWLVPEGNSFPDSVSQSGDRFAMAVSSWFSGGQAAGFPCATAMARKSQLASAATGALSAKSAQAAGTQLAMGVAAYIAGQSFGTGVATFPTGAAGAVSQIIAVFSDTNKDATVAEKAQKIATACTLLATTTLVAFPVPPGPPTAPIT